MNAQKTLQLREKELQAMMATPEGRETLQELASRYAEAGGPMRPRKASVITYILVWERERGLIRG